MRDIGAYIAENLRLSFSAWGQAQRVGSLTAAVVSLIVAILALMGANAKLKPDTFQEIAILAGAWFFVLVIIVTPYRMWLAQRRHIAQLNVQIHDAIIEPGRQALLEQKRRQEKADGYQQLLERCHALRDRTITSAEELSQLEKDIEQWRDEATAFVRVNDGHAQARHFTKSFIVSELFYRPAGFNGNHVSKLQVLNVYRERLQALHDTARDCLI